MPTEFVKTETKKVIQDVVDGRLPNCALMSVKSSGCSSSVVLVIGAKWENRFGYSFRKPELQKLIDILQEIHDAMED